MEETILKISTNYKFKKREFLHLNNNANIIEDENAMLLYTDIKVTNSWFKIKDHVYVDEKDYKDETEYEGVVIETTKQKIVLGISLEKACCEEFGSGIILPEKTNMDDFIGKKVQRVAISLDWDWNIEKGLQFKEGCDVDINCNDVDGEDKLKYHSYDEGGSVTIRIYCLKDSENKNDTELDIIKIYAYNIYGDHGDYKHNYYLSFYEYEDEGEL